MPLHRSEENHTETSNVIEELNTMINKLKLNIQEKDSEIISQKKGILKQNVELNDEEKEISEKDEIINIMKHSLKSSDNEDEDFNVSNDEKADSDTNSTFDFAQLDLSVEEVLQEVKEKGIDNDFHRKIGTKTNGHPSS